MFTTSRIATALAGPTIIAGILAGALALGAPANAAPTTNEATCTTAKVVAGLSNSSLLTRAGQVNLAGEARQPVTATSCIGH